MKLPADKDAALQKIVDKIHQSDIAVFGFMDYWMFDGYLLLKDYLQRKNITLTKQILPGMELRIDAPVDFRLNIQVLLSDSLSTQQLLDFKSALEIGTINRPLSDESLIAFARTLDQSKASIHGFQAADLSNDTKLLELGSMTAKITRESLREAMKRIPEKTCLIVMPYDTSDGLLKLDWKKHPYDDSYFMQTAHIFETRDAANVDLFLNRETSDNKHFIANFVKTMGGNAKPVISGSDAHKIGDYGEFPSNRITWLKADPTFEGLQQVVNEPRERCFIGELPPKLDLVAKKKTKFISSIQIARKPGATISEVWFDNITLPINPDLVAIIGNKGKGKSALTDIIGLLGNTKQHNEFTFLSSDSFRQVKDNKAKHFQATLTWESGVPVTKGLEELVDERQPELVKYIPQNFLEKICTQIGRLEETEFDRELKKVIFSHVVAADRLNKTSLDELLAYKTSEAMAKIELLKQELRQLNEGIVLLEEKTQAEYRERIQNLLNVKQTELRTLENSKPAEVTKPENDPTKQQEISKVAQAIEEAKTKLVETEKQILSANEEISKQTQLVAVADRLIERLENLERQVQTFFTDSKEDFEALGLSTDAVVKVVSNKQLVTDKRTASAQAKQRQEEQLDATKLGSLAKKKLDIETEITQLQSKLDEPNKKYQLYAAALKAWEAQKAAVVGTDKDVGTIKFHEKQLNDLANVPNLLSQRRTERLTKAKEIHAEIKKLASTFRQLYAAVNQFIEEKPLAKDTLHLNFEVSVVDTGFEDRFFEILNRGVVGTFFGIEEGHKKLEEFLQSYDFNTELGIESFLIEMTKALEFDLRTSDAKPVRVVDQIRKGKDKSVLGLYDFIFSLDFLRPRYALQMGDKELHELSPGERGALLLVFYLLVDKDDVPLVIDQPEENLDNQTVYELLVPCMKAAKQRRQIFIVTHNPNLAVVCDAEQVICADLDKKNQYRMRYLPGAIENPAINKAIVDILEGTMPAFDNRDSKYYE
jgi:ABC-type lipoprotein export system ATPase subunit